MKCPEKFWNQIVKEDASQKFYHYAIIELQQLFENDLNF